MKLIRIIIIFTCILAPCIAQPLEISDAFTAIAESIQATIDELDSDSAQSIAIYYFTTNGERTALGDVLSQELTTFLAGHTGENIQIVSRDQVEVIMKEHSFQLSGLAEESQIVDIGKKLSAHYIGTGFLLVIEISARLNFQLIHVESGEVVAGEILSMKLTEELSRLSGESKSEPVLEYPAEFAYVDPFDELNSDVWTTTRKDKDISIDVDSGVLRFFVEDRQDVNAASIYSRDFRVSSYTMEVTFRDPLLTSYWVSLTVGNKQFADGASFQIVANVYDGYYICRWRKSGETTWLEDVDNIKDDTAYDSDTVFHTLSISYDLQNKTASAFLDGELVSYVEDFAYNRKDRLQTLLSVNCMGKDMNVEFDTFRSTIGF